jgi:hypothetical protein
MWKERTSKMGHNELIWTAVVYLGCAIVVIATPVIIAMNLSVDIIHFTLTWDSAKYPMYKEIIAIINFGLFIEFALVVTAAFSTAIDMGV